MTHVWIERRPVGYPTAEVAHDADDDDAGLQTGRPSLRSAEGQFGVAGGRDATHNVRTNCVSPAGRS